MVGRYISEKGFDRGRSAWWERHGLAKVPYFSTAPSPPISLSCMIYINEYQPGKAELLHIILGFTVEIFAIDPTPAFN